MLTKIITFTSLLMFVQAGTAMAQDASPGTPSGNNPLLGLKNMNSPQDGGPPLPPPAATKETRPDQALLQLCLKLKEAKASPDFCK
ncbi:hypothetical protein IVB03_13995 [Bradyrhizobium sp. 168]|uniref:hypothetical protein n=1 Tax=Bradyrhizobium sp. 168 TaxID=2782639 RepID=UPI001FF8016D|nr:hypothetical protein [Bradyrhizobium sp. 168]MCK1580663.1 hypothetical protein [Bradyrhizobium sp. 168]